MKISGKQVGSLALISYAAYEGCKLYTQGTSYGGITKVALALIGTGALLYADQSSAEKQINSKRKVSDKWLEKVVPKANPISAQKRTVSAEELQKALESLKQYRNSSSTSSTIQKMIEAAEKTHGFTEQNFIPSTQKQEIDLIVNAPFMWGISPNGNPYFCLLVNTSKSPAHLMLILSEETDNLRPKREMEGKSFGFLHFSENIVNEKGNALAIHQIIQNQQAQGFHNVSDGKGGIEKRVYKMSLFDRWGVLSLGNECRTLHLRFCDSSIT